MLEEAKINFYSITKIGYFKQSTSTHVFGDLSSILSQLQSWTSAPDVVLDATCTYPKSAKEGNGLRTFCFDMVEEGETGDFFLTTWNETPTTKGKVPSVHGDQPVGEAEVVLNKIPKNTIPGYATYFWFLPDLNIFATIRFHHLLNGQQNLVKYISGFMKTFSTYADKEKIDDGNFNILGYRKTVSDEVLDLYPSFKTQLIRSTGELDLIKKKTSKIRKVIRKSSLDLEVPEEKKLLKKMFQKLGMGYNEESADNSLNINYSMPIKPTEQDVNDIIDNVMEEGVSSSNDVGFQLTGSSETYWLSNSIVKHYVKLDFERENEEIVKLSSLAKKLTSQRDIVTKMINSKL